MFCATPSCDGAEPAVVIHVDISGSLLVERFFSVPGMGPLLTDAITRYDLNMVRGLVLLYSLLGVFGLFLGDVLMTIFDPRIRLTGKSGDTR